MSPFQLGRLMEQPLSESVPSSPPMSRVSWLVLLKNCGSHYHYSILKKFHLNFLFLVLLRQFLNSLMLQTGCLQIKNFVMAFYLILQT